MTGVDSDRVGLTDMLAMGSSQVNDLRELLDCGVAACRAAGRLGQACRWKTQEGGRQWRGKEGRVQEAARGVGKWFYDEAGLGEAGGCRVVDEAPSLGRNRGWRPWLRTLVSRVPGQWAGESGGCLAQNIPGQLSQQPK